MGWKRQEAVLLAPGQQILLKEPGELLQAAGRKGQRAAAVQDHVTCKAQNDRTGFFLKREEEQRETPNLMRRAGEGIN